MDISIGGRNTKLYKTTSGQSQNPAPLLSFVLRVGVILSGLVIGLGLVLFVITGQSGYTTTGASGAAQFTSFQSDNGSQLFFPTSPLEIWQGVLALKPFALIMLGLLLLIATPVLNVALAAAGFLRRHDRAFSLISLFVLAMLILSFLLGTA